MENNFDLIVIGSGPAGYVGAIRASQLGMKVACVEKEETLGGTCLNVGCIPSKAMLHSSHKYEESAKHFSEHGIEAKVKLNLKQMLSRKEKVVEGFTSGVSGLFAKNKITRFKGTASLVDNNTVEVRSNDKTTLTAKNILIATGSTVANPVGLDIDESKIVTSTGALNLTKVPKKMVVIGGGYIGLELGSVWRRLGAEVEVVEYIDRVVPAADKEVSKQFQKSLEAQGMKFRFNTKVTEAKKTSSGVEISLDSESGSDKIKADILLAAVGRKPNTENLNLKSCGISTDEGGRINVDGHYRTGVGNIYAVGDVISGPMLAHKAEDEAIAAVERMAGQAGGVNYEAIPSVIYTHPEVASVGSTEEDLKQNNIQYYTGKFPFKANSRARTIAEEEGFVKILADKETDRVLGAHIIGPNAGDLITELSLGMEYKAAAEDIFRSSHPHPGLGEAVKEAALAVHKRTINM
jgi:dihydrolipoamide dehydrogenase